MISATLKTAIEAKIANPALNGFATTEVAKTLEENLGDEMKTQVNMFAGFAPSGLNVPLPDLTAYEEGSFGCLVNAARTDAASKEFDNARLAWALLFGLELRPSTHWALGAIEAIQRPHVEGNFTVTMLLARIAFITPEANIPVYDLLAAAWETGKAAKPIHETNLDDFWAKPIDEVRTALNIKPVDLPSTDALAEAEDMVLAPAEWSEGLAAGIWNIIEDLEQNAGNAGLITMNVAALGAHYSPELMEATSRSLLRFDGVEAAMKAGHPEDIQIEDLKDKPLGTLGHSFYRLITDNNFSVEVLDYDGMNEGDAAAIPEPVKFTSKRILQCHDLWHMTANYHVTPMHEISISGFQLGQFGQNYSAAFLAVIQLISMFNMPISTTMLSDLTFEGWRHARKTPSMIGVNWHKYWDMSIEEVRTDLGVTPYKSAHDDAMMPNQVPVHHATFDTFDQPIAAE